MNEIEVNEKLCDILNQSDTANSEQRIIDKFKTALAIFIDRGALDAKIRALNTQRFSVTIHSAPAGPNHMGLGEARNCSWKYDSNGSMTVYASLVC